MKKIMLINVRELEECRIAVLEDGVLQELYIERTGRENLVGNIYKGRVVNIEPSIQAAFVDFGIGRNGFLHVSDVDPHYYRHVGGDNGQTHALLPTGGEQARGANRHSGERSSRTKPPIQSIFRRGQEVLVQVIRDSVGSKGPTLSTYISIPGRYLVLMPGLNRVGVSRKIEDEKQRRALREMLKSLQLPKGLGFIIRTAGQDRTKRDLARDLAYLTRVWKVVVRRINKLRSPAPVYVESDLIIRTMRDIFTSDVDEIWVDDPQAYEEAREFLAVTMPRYLNRLKLHQERLPLLHKFGIEEQIDRIHQREVPLPEGGSIVIDQTEALVAIDVNSGSFHADDSAEETAYRINLAAATEIARQVRLRDLGGVIVCDFIDMRDQRHKRKVEQTLREAVKRDRARTKLLRMSAFCLVEMTRQRIRQSLWRSIYDECPTCGGSGQVKSTESVAIEVMRSLQLACIDPDIARIDVEVHPDVVQYLINRKRKELAEIEEREKKTVTVRSAQEVQPDHLVTRCYEASGAERPLPKVGSTDAGEGQLAKETRSEQEAKGRQAATPSRDKATSSSGRSRAGAGSDSEQEQARSRPRSAGRRRPGSMRKAKRRTRPSRQEAEQQSEMNEAERIVAERIDSEPPADSEPTAELETAPEPQPEAHQDHSAAEETPAHAETNQILAQTEYDNEPAEEPGPTEEKERDLETEPEWLLPEEKR